MPIEIIDHEEAYYPDETYPTSPVEIDFEEPITDGDWDQPDENADYSE